MFRVGLIGCGRISDAWLEAVRLHSDCRIAFAYDCDPRAAERRAAETGARVASSLHMVLNSPEVDVILVATPPATHAAFVIAAARAGKHVLCEKPMALTLGDCRRMQYACIAAKVKIAVGHSLRFWGAFRTCRRLIAEGAIGTPLLGSIDRIRRSGNEDDATDPSWRDDVLQSGGILLEEFIHELDFARVVFGEPASVSCAIVAKERLRMVHGLVTFESGACVTLRVGRTVALPVRGYWLAGTGGGLRFVSWRGPVEHFRPEQKEPVAVPCSEVSAYYLELCDLLDAITHDRQPENSGANGEKNVGLGLALYRAAETGQPVVFRDGMPLNLSDDYRGGPW